MQSITIMDLDDVMGMNNAEIPTLDIWFYIFTIKLQYVSIKYPHISNFIAKYSITFKSGIDIPPYLCYQYFLKMHTKTFLLQSPCLLIFDEKWEMKLNKA